MIIDPLSILSSTTSNLKENFAPQEGFFVDITKVTKDILGIKMMGYRALTAHFMKGRIVKSSQMSNWEKDILSTKEIIFAATDALVSLKVYSLA